MDVVTLSHFSERVRHAGVKDEWIVWLRLAGGNHAAAFMLRACVKWGSRKEGGWFYKTDADWRDELDLHRGKLGTAKKILKLVEVIETRRQRVSVNSPYVMGKTVTHYRVNPKGFIKALDSVLDALTGKRIDAPEEGVSTHESSTSECNFFTLTTAQNLPQSSHESDISQCQESAPVDVKEPQLNLTGSLMTDSSDRSDRQTHLSNGQREIPQIETLKAVFAGFNPDVRGQLIAHYDVLGAERFEEVVKRCATGVHWKYVLTALGNEITRLAVAAATPAPLPPSPIEPEAVPAQDFEAKMSEFFGGEEDKADATPEQIRVFDAAWQQLGLQLDRASFDLYARGAKLVSVSTDGCDWQISVQHPAAVNALQHRLYRMVHRLMVDCGAHNANIQFVARTTAGLGAAMNSVAMSMMMGAG